MAALSNYQAATLQISQLSRMLANNPAFREQFEDAMTAMTARTKKMRKVLRQNGITYPFRIVFAAHQERVQIWAPVTNPQTRKKVNVGFTYRMT